MALSCETAEFCLFMFNQPGLCDSLLLDGEEVNNQLKFFFKLLENSLKNGYKWLIN